jgi:hypothetical protein
MKTNFTPHTPGPWAVTKIWNEGTQRFVISVESSVGIVARVPNEANAAFIVRACNSFEDLLEYLEVMTYWASLATNTAMPPSHLVNAKAAIAKAKGE